MISVLVFEAGHFSAGMSVQSEGDDGDTASWKESHEEEVVVFCM